MSDEAKLTTQAAPALALPAGSWTSFWETWRNIAAGLAFLACLAGLGFVVYSVHEMLATQREEKAYKRGRSDGYDKGYQDGKQDCKRVSGGTVKREPKRSENRRDPGCWLDDDPETGWPPSIRLNPCDRVRNHAAKDGCGLNVLACLETAARHQGIECLCGLVERHGEKGGAWPERVDSILKAELARGGSFVYEQHERADINGLIEDALDRREVPCVSDHGPGRYAGRLYTMVCVLHLDPADAENPRACLYDPNWPDKLEWLSRDDFNRRIVYGSGGKSWLVLLRKTKETR